VCCALSSSSAAAAGQQGEHVRLRRDGVRLQVPCGAARALCCVHAGARLRTTPVRLTLVPPCTGVTACAPPQPHRPRARLRGVRHALPHAAATRLRRQVRGRTHTRAHATPCERVPRLSL
jgi:hypothetical protein